jgi:site-specific DNA-adenine methylase
MAFILNYVGSKYKETQELEFIDFNSFKTIIEPFCGSFGFSRYLYKHGWRGKFILYDINEELIDFLNYIKGLNEDEFKNFVTDYNNLNKLVFDKCSLNRDKSMIDNKIYKNFLETLEEDKIKWLLKHNISTSLIARIYPKNKLDPDFFNMLQDCDFIYKSFVEIDISEFNKDTTLFYLDPPYLLESNISYKSTVEEMKEYYEKIELLFENYHALMIHSYNWLIDKIWGKYKIGSYQKRYGSQRKREHIIFMS